MSSKSMIIMVWKDRRCGFSEIHPEISIPLISSSFGYFLILSKKTNNSRQFFMQLLSQICIFLFSELLAWALYLGRVILNDISEIPLVPDIKYSPESRKIKKLKIWLSNCIKNCLELSLFLTEFRNIQNSRRLMELKFLNLGHVFSKWSWVSW